MKNLNIKTKMTIAIIIIPIILSIIGIVTANSINRQYNYTLSFPDSRLHAAFALQSDIMNARRVCTKMTKLLGVEEAEQCQKDLSAIYAGISDKIENYLSLIKSDQQIDQADAQAMTAAAEQIRISINKYKADITDKQYAAALAGDFESQKLIAEASVPFIGEMNEAVNQMVKNATESVSDRNSKVTDSVHRYTLLLIVLAVLITSLSLAIVFVMTSQITKPLAEMVIVAGELSQGNTNVNIHYDTKDEVGRLASCFRVMIDSVKEQQKLVEDLAGGDFSVDINLRGSHDGMGLALQKIAKNLNDMFHEIHSTTTLVNIGAKRIADGSQALSRGSIEQAAAVEQLSASINEVSGKTKKNTETAEHAANLGDTIKRNAEKGSQQMGQMMRAVGEINEASQNINKVIKVIDDIAFQTNILALNAAVEAARAGQHGKGFAVVAEEVRSLAAKSAEAAKNTDSLIANSIEKAELGARIAGETSVSFEEIVSGINESSKLVNDIAESSKEQTAAVTQINRGIEQVAQVVQQNSATAEESAAASEDMSNQADTLESLVSQFKLKETHQRRV